VHHQFGFFYTFDYKEINPDILHKERGWCCLSAEIGMVV